MNKVGYLVVALLSLARPGQGDTGGGHAHGHAHDHSHASVVHQSPSSSYSSPTSYSSASSYSSAPASTSGGKCVASYSLTHLRSSLQDLDYQMQATLAALPHAIEAARSAVQSGNLDTNRDQLLVGLFCLIGAVSGSLGILHNKNPLALSQSDSIYLFAMNSWGYGYWGPYLLELSDSDPGCGVEDFNRVIYEYSFVTSLEQVYGSDPGYGGFHSYNPDDRPELRRYYLGEFSRKLKLALHCITSKASGVEEARNVVSLIDKFIKLANQRLDITLQLMH